MSDVLLADIGATNARFAVIGPDGRPARIIKWRGNEIASLEAGIARYLDETGVSPRAAVLGIAGPVEGGVISMTNRNWKIRVSDLAKRFGWSASHCLNDFEAVAWSIDRLRPSDVRPLGPALPETRAPRAVFGPGTGLGVAGLLPEKAGWRVVASEGGHVSFGAASDDEERIFSKVRLECVISAECVLSGPGLERLHRAMHSSSDKRAAADITRDAHNGDPAARETVKMFVRLFGRFAGDLAVMFKATGGIYIGGGVARRMSQFLDDPVFREAFEYHPPYRHLLEKIPSTLITLDEPGLLGCAVIAEEMLAHA